MSQSEIIVSNNPRGIFREVVVSGTPKPGTLMEYTDAAEDSGGHPTVQVYQPGTDGYRNKGGIMILLERWLLGKRKEDAYVSGELGMVYFPVAGEEFKMLVKNESGTADDHALNEVLIGDSGSGMLVPTAGTPHREPFLLREAITDPTADTHALCVYTGE